ncbi:LPPG:FO 2-phospho-L-lactate transferase [Ferrithrix thermotolerans DSM 19514]|uniref:LPPG:FO 2-phospho-L-lactate transferase n=1 Tax=Ferrithrix thermotolerans DSM 19514 TaxID=1121881 RepID=A0A1M4V5S8_9ACTN|nr:2-phospho-L-lactate transferase [Ferrithrix thermotolerans]SHE64257.1 LPPG:FO 2-phospho-L-lactate transferase [Ferrithrix thermotolerans DSM 19514]
MITVLAGGVGGSKFIRGLANSVSPSSLVAIVNVGDDEQFYGLHVSPDIDTVTYALAGLSDDERGWGVKGETYNALNMVKTLGDDAWFTLGDQDLGTHLYRTKRLRDGLTLSEVTAEIITSLGVQVRVLPFSDDPVRTKIRGHRYISETDSYETEAELMSFQEYFVKYNHRVKVKELIYEGADTARLSQAVVRSLEDSSKVIIAPSNPLLSIWPMLMTSNFSEILLSRRADVTAVSPIVGGSAVKGPLGDLLADLHGQASACAVAKLYSPYISTFVIDIRDKDQVEAISELGIKCVVTDILMVNREMEIQLAKEVCGLE